MTIGLCFGGTVLALLAIAVVALCCCIVAARADRWMEG